jgi:hypothetical protein
LTNPFPGVPLIESPLFPMLMPSLALSAEEECIAIQLYEKGYAVFDFPDPALDARIDRIKQHLAPVFDIDLGDPATHKTGRDLRIQDGWRKNDDIRAIASNPSVLDLLSKLYGRPAFPFQTLNFPVGTQQAVHSDSVHFSSLPERFMCGVWLAMEDVTQDAGPLFYYPGSHQWPIVNNAMIGRRGYGSELGSAQDPYAPAWDALCAAHSAQRETFLARKGQALIWCANLLHGGSPQTDPCRTRWSQVTHYYFDDCIYYTPAFSDEAVGDLHLRTINAISDDLPRPNSYLGEKIAVARPKTETPEPPMRRVDRLIKHFFGRGA